MVCPSAALQKGSFVSLQKRIVNYPWCYLHCVANSDGSLQKEHGVAHLLVSAQSTGAYSGPGQALAVTSAGARTVVLSAVHTDWDEAVTSASNEKLTELMVKALAVICSEGLGGPAARPLVRHRAVQKGGSGLAGGRSSGQAEHSFTVSPCALSSRLVTRDQRSAEGRQPAPLGVVCLWEGRASWVSRQVLTAGALLRCGARCNSGCQPQTKRMLLLSAACNGSASHHTACSLTASAIGSGFWVCLDTDRTRH